SQRDGARALALAKALFEATKNPDVGQTYAMAFAETGRYDQAVVLQRETIIVLERTGGERRKPFLQRNLALYEQHKPTPGGGSAERRASSPRSPAVGLERGPWLLSAWPLKTSRTALRQIMARAQASGLLDGRPAELAEQFCGLLWCDWRPASDRAKYA